MTNLNEKLPYAAPKLTVYGDFAQLTAAGSTSSKERATQGPSTFAMRRA